jgi:hypothetical protein
LEPLRLALLEHPIYSRINDLESLRVFMQHHVFAVWDFMSLLKTLQRQLCDTRVPWVPPANRLSSRMVNEIVLAEESDEDGSGGYASHFDLYHEAMARCGATTTVIDGFLAAVAMGADVRHTLKKAEAPETVQEFVLQTFEVIDSGDMFAVAAAFTFGREDLLPDLFRQIVERLSIEADSGLASFKYYLERHIDLDGDQHGPMAERLIELLCGESNINWQAAEGAAVQALESRLLLWDRVNEAVVALAR